MLHFQRTIFAVASVLALATVHEARAQSAPPNKAERAALTAEVKAQLAAANKKDRNLAILQGILSQPDDSIDLAKAEVAIEKMIDPSVNEVDTLKQLDALAASVRGRFPQGDATDNELKVVLLMSTLKDPGPWNGYRPFHYDLDDPMGKDLEQKLLSRYLVSHKGNCVSMPVLFVVLGQKLGLPVTLSTAPTHDFAKFRRDSGAWMNMEVTSYGTKTDQSYEQELRITPRAVQTGIYLQTLTRKQSVLVMVNTLMEFYRHHRSPEQRLALTTVVLTTDPKFVAGWLWRGQAYYGMVDEKFKRFGSVANIPQQMRDGYMVLNQNAEMMFQRASDLGWAPETPEQDAEYLKYIQKAKASQQGG